MVEKILRVFGIVLGIVVGVVVIWPIIFHLAVVYALLWRELAQWYAGKSGSPYETPLPRELLVFLGVGSVVVVGYFRWLFNVRKQPRVPTQPKLTAAERANHLERVVERHLKDLDSKSKR